MILSFSIPFSSVIGLFDSKVSFDITFAVASDNLQFPIELLSPQTFLNATFPKETVEGL